MVRLENIVNQIAIEGDRLVTHFIDRKDLTGVIDYATIFPRSAQEYVRYSKIVQKNRKIAGELSTGNYYWLDEPIITPIGTVRRMRVHEYDKKLTQCGYIDYEVKDYVQFKRKYLSLSECSIVDYTTYELVQLKLVKFKVLVYFPNIF
ncbi:MAG: hypothetical protein AAB893_00900 [Patescibacteria group bacterium]